MHKFLNISVMVLATSVVVSCSSTPRRVQPERVLVKHAENELLLDTPPGTVRDIWAEKMVDQVRVPGQIDPNGVYYRKPHETLIEVRPGRYQQVQYPDDYIKAGSE